MTLVLAIDSLDVLEQILPLGVWIWLVAATLVLMVAGAFLWLRIRREAHLAALRLLRQARTSPVGGRVTASPEPAGPGPDVFDKAAGAPTAVFVCASELEERRPLSEAQWDAEVPAAWTVFRLAPENHPDAAFRLGLLLPIRAPRAYSSGFLERLDGSDAEAALSGFSRALAGPVPPPEVRGTEAGFIDFRTDVRNEHPDVIPGSLDRNAADYWIVVRAVVQDSLVLYVRLNVARDRAELTTDNPAHGEQLLRVLAATLRPV